MYMWLPHISVPSARSARPSYARPASNPPKDQHNNQINNGTLERDSAAAVTAAAAAAANAAPTKAVPGTMWSYESDTPFQLLTTFVHCDVSDFSIYECILFLCFSLHR